MVYLLTLPNEGCQHHDARRLGVFVVDYAVRLFRSTDRRTFDAGGGPCRKERAISTTTLSRRRFGSLPTEE